jgi:hypothetical protein
MLVLSVALLVACAILYFRLRLNDTPLQNLPGEYWLLLVLMLLSSFGLMLSTHGLKFTYHSVWASFVGLGIAFLVPFLFDIGRYGWTGNTVASAVGSVVYFSLALIVRLSERRSKLTSPTSPNNSETA